MIHKLLNEILTEMNEKAETILGTKMIRPEDAISAILKFDEYEGKSERLHRLSEYFTVENGEGVHTFDTLDEAQAFAKGKVYYMYVTRSKRI